jgi:hypothetical protein
MTKHVKIAGKEYAVKYGFAALMEFTDMLNISMNELESIGNNMSLTNAVSLIWCGLKHGARSEKKEFGMAIEDVADLLDDDMKAMEKVLAVFAESFGEEEEKK